MTLLLVRHGETPLNVARVLQPADTPLSARGIEQAQALARRLAGMQVAAIVSSDLPRAHHTAELIAAASGVPIEISELLRERNFGDWRGLAYDTLPVNPLLMADAPPGGESVAVFEARVAQAFALVVRRASRLTSGALVVVSHGLVLRAMLGAHIALPDGIAVPAHMGNTCVNVVDARPPHTASLVNCTRHLAPATDDDPRTLSGG
jgi:probable phosphoglycerate mutase